MYTGWQCIQDGSVYRMYTGWQCIQDDSVYRMYGMYGTIIKKGVSPQKIVQMTLSHL